MGKGEGEGKVNGSGMGKGDGEDARAGAGARAGASELSGAIAAGNAPGARRKKPTMGRNLVRRQACFLPPALNRAKAQHACVLRLPECGGAGCQ